MPIQVYMEVNGRPVTTVHIGRIKGGTHPDDVNLYSVVAKDDSGLPISETRRYVPDYPTNAEWDNGPIFEHRYGDGLEVCVEKALTQLRKTREEQEEIPF